MELKHIQVMPYLSDGELVIELAIEDIPVTPVAQKLEQVFEEFLDFRRNPHDSGLDPKYLEEVINMVATLRTIAREMETETDGIRRGLH